MKKIIVLFNGINAPWHITTFALNIARQSNAQVHALFLNDERRDNPYPNDMKSTGINLTGKSEKTENEELEEKNIEVFKAFCILQNCPTIITSANDGLEYQFGPSKPFDVILDSTKYDISGLACHPANIIGYASNSSSVQPPLFTVRFEGVGLGECILSDGDFSVKIKIVMGPFLFLHSTAGGK